MAPDLVDAEPVPDFTYLRCAGVSILVDHRERRCPAIVHWGADLGALTAADAAVIADGSVLPRDENGPDQPVRVAILPQLAEGWMGTPGVRGARAEGSYFSPLLQAVAVRHEPLTALNTNATAEPSTHDAASPVGTDLIAMQAGRVTWVLRDDAVGINVELTLQMLDSGLVRMRAQLTNIASTAYCLQGLTLAYPVPIEATELLDFHGRWGKERVPQRSAFTVGTHLKENRRGRTGMDTAYVLHAGPAGFDFGHGEVHAVHTAFSGNHVHLAEKSANGQQILGGGELLLPGEGHLEPEASYTSPWIYGSYGQGLDAIAHRFHRYLRQRPHHPSTERPMTLNVWEAVYFDHDLERLQQLADRAAELGVERYVLDDGWFGSRRDDTSGLGDWVVSPDVWPDGLSPLIDYVTGLGMQFGLWFEPEMVNEDSEVARAHPEWIMAPAPDRLPVRARNQQVLNLTIPEAYAHVRDQMVAVLEQYDISYVKWDFNRDLLESGTRATGAAATHEQTLASYRLLAELKERFPGLEIESCSSGGARVDLGVLEHTDRVWASDCIDPLERQHIMRWTTQLIPFELIGSHIASGRSHTTGRLHSLSFRAATALLGHLGIEWDLTEASPAEMRELKAWIELYKQVRELVFTGDLVRMDRADGSMHAYGVTAPDRTEALFIVAALERPAISPQGKLRLRGLEPAQRYRVRAVLPGGEPSGFRTPVWWEQATSPAGLEISGAALMQAGLATPDMHPEQAFALHLTPIDG